MTAPLRVGLAGLGTVGVGVVRMLQAHGAEIAARAGRAIEIVAVSARDRARDRGVDLSGYRWVDDPIALAGDPEIDVVVELIGGADGPALLLATTALNNGRSVVTANKAMLAEQGDTLAHIAEAKGAALAYEAAVAGGIPIVKALREGLAGNRIERIYGILNGTCNYILTTMRESGRSFDDVLAEAQQLGYAEADPGFDVDGIDAAHKLSILASIAFGSEIDFAGVHIEGIRHVSPVDIAFAEELNYRIKLIGSARRTALGIEQRVHPCMIPLAAPIAHVEGVFNAVVAQGDFVQDSIYTGRGAGQGPTASAVLADLIDLAAGRRAPTFGTPAASLSPARRAPMDRHVGAYYVRLTVRDRPGVIAAVSAILRDAEISMEAIIQRGRDPESIVPVVMTTHETEEAAMRMALAQIDALSAMAEPARMIRIETL
ncbi:MAG: homoserine dehydrogenase [Alphaproteobacteria bacterium]